MPTFFTQQTITPEQKINFDKAIIDYQKIIALTPKSFMSNPPGHEKSALFYRLLNGYKALLFPPPTAFSYPQYSYIENPINELSMFDCSDLKYQIRKKNKYIPYKHIILEQTPWKILKEISPTKIILTYGEWEKENITWTLELKKIDTKTSTSFIVSHHNPKISRITNYSDLLKEEIFKVRNRYNTINIFLDKIHLNLFLISQIKKYGESLAKQFTEQSLIQGEKLLKKRQELNLSNFPSDEEIEIESKNNIQNNYLSKDYSLDEDGNLIFNSWTISINLNKPIENYYLNL